MTVKQQLKEREGGKEGEKEGGREGGREGEKPSECRRQAAQALQPPKAPMVVATTRICRGITEERPAPFET